MQNARSLFCPAFPAPALCKTRAKAVFHADPANTLTSFPPVPGTAGATVGVAVAVAVAVENAVGNAVENAVAVGNAVGTQVNAMEGYSSAGLGKTVEVG